MLKLRGRLDLREKTLGPECSGEIGMQNFYRDVAIVSEIVSEVDGRHSTGADFAVDAIAIVESRSELVDYRHGERLR